MYFTLIAAMIFVSATLAGMFAPALQKPDEDTTVLSHYECCDTGSGSKCRAQEEKPQVQYQGKQYALLKSNILPITNLAHTTKHFAPGGYAPGLGRIFTIIYERKNDGNISAECTNANKGSTDWLIGPPDPDNPAGDIEHEGKGCFSVPNGLIIYICRPDNDAGECDQGQLPTNEVQFDAYIRIEDIKPGGALGKIPYAVANCIRPPSPPPAQRVIKFRPSPDGQNNLQLRTFSFYEVNEPLPFLNPYCKPAIYLYPEKKTEINVSVYPQGKMLLTIPPYPKLGWDVVADPNGKITYHNELFDYLYYEASIPDQLIEKPKEGYIMPYAERETFLRDLVVKLGLNEKETQQFVEYWAGVLPKSPYYFVGMVPVSNLHEISPLLISPKPDNLIRITLYFEPLQKPITVAAPKLHTVSRTGFTAVEWGGIVKRDKDHPFSCFM